MNDKQAKYTAPWKYELRHGFHHTVTDANDDTVSFDISTKSNAQLISLSPELAEVLQEMVDTYEHEASMENPTLLKAHALLERLP